MDPAVFMQGNFNSYALGFFLGIDGTETPQQKAHSKQQALRLLEHYGVIPRRETSANCPDCNASLTTIADRARYGWRYYCMHHQKGRKFSPLDNTFLKKARLNSEMPADKIVRVIDMWLTLTPLISVQEVLSVSAHTACSWYEFCRDIACAIAWHDYIPIGGAEDVVEVDESLLFRRKDYVGTVNHIWVVGGISRTTKKVFGVIIDGKDDDSLIPILQQCIDGNTYVCTDPLKGYEKYELLFNGHVRMDQECLDLQGDRPSPLPKHELIRKNTQNIKKAWRDLKGYMSTSNNVEFASQYVGEWMYRNNSLKEYKNDKGKFEKFLRDIGRVYPGVGKKPMKKRYEDIPNCDCHECES